MHKVLRNTEVVYLLGKLGEVIVKWDETAVKMSYIINQSDFIELVRSGDLRN